MKHSNKSLRTALLMTGICALVITGCGKSPTSKNEVSIQEMSRALSVMSRSPAGAPRNFLELTNFPAFKGRPFPAPPAGKKFVIDPATGQVVVVDQ